MTIRGVSVTREEKEVATKAKAKKAAAPAAAADGVKKEVKAAAPHAEFFHVDPKVIVVDKGFNPRFDFTGQDDMNRMVAVRGVEVPIQVSLEADGKYHLRNGERRLRAALKAKLKQIPCTLAKGKTEREHLLLALSTNAEKPLLPLEQAEAYRRLVDLGMKDGTYKTLSAAIKGISEQLGMSMSHVRGRLDLISAHKDVKAAVAAGRIPATLGTEIARSAKDKRRQKRLVKKATSSKNAKREVSESVGKKAPPIRALKKAIEDMTEKFTSVVAKLNKARAKDRKTAVPADLEDYLEYAGKVEILAPALVAGAVAGLETLLMTLRPRSAKKKGARSRKRVQVVEPKEKKEKKEAA